MTAMDLDALDKLRGAATPGPWLHRFHVGASGAVSIVVADGYGFPAECADQGGDDDAALIVAAVNALPDLIAEARKYRALREAQDGAGLIATERQRQIEAEGWTPEHDAEHGSDILTRAAVCYALPERDRGNWVRWDLWPWEERYWKPSPADRIRELTKAGALIAAEIDRLRAVVATVESGDQQ